MCGPQLMKRSFSTLTMRLQVGHIIPSPHDISERVTVRTPLTMAPHPCTGGRLPLGSKQNLGGCWDPVAPLPGSQEWVRLTFSWSIVRLRHLSGDFDRSIAIFAAVHIEIIYMTAENIIPQPLTTSLRRRRSHETQVRLLSGTARPTIRVAGRIPAY
jgi:hypothetical protein